MGQVVSAILASLAQSLRRDLVDELVKRTRGESTES